MGRLHRLFAAGLIGAALASPPASAFLGGADVKDTRLVQAEKLVKDKDYAKAIPLLEQVIMANPRDADANNYLGYSHRKLGRMDQARDYYLAALRLEPNHRGANEYLGELYLEMNDLPKAEERLAVLARACQSRCEEYRDLKQAVDAFKAGKPRS
ncbi:MAG: tetratricopeptide repeat protein [Pseudomonadota bacterium]